MIPSPDDTSGRGIKKAMSEKKTLLALLPPFWPKLPPLGIAYLQAYALKEGVSVDIFDFNRLNR